MSKFSLRLMFEMKTRLLTCQHVDVSAVGNGENMRRHFIPPLASVQFSATVRVHGEPFVRINGHTEQTGVSLDITSVLKN